MGKLLFFVVGVVLGSIFSSTIKTKILVPVKTWFLNLFVKKVESVLDPTTSSATSVGATASK